MDYIVHGVAKSRTQLSNFHFTSLHFTPWWFNGKASACNAGDLGSTPGLGRSPGDRNGNLLQYSCLENHHRGVWPATLHGVAKRPRQLSTHSFTHSPHIYCIPCCCCSAAKLCPALCNPMDGSMPGSSVLHYLLEFA